MSKPSKRASTELSKQTDNNTQKRNLRETLVSAFVSAIVSAVLSIAGTLLINYAVIQRELGELSQKYEHTQEKINEYKGDLSKIDDKLDERFREMERVSNENSTSIKGIEIELKELKSESNNGTSMVLKGIDEFSITYKTSAYDTNIEQPTWKMEQLIAVDTVSGDSYTAERLAGKHMTLYYIENGQTVIFSGMYNDSLHWDGRCILNVYSSDGTLMLVTEANYEDGKRIDYKQIIYDHTRNEIIFSDREVRADKNYGKSVVYQRKSDISMSFELDKITATDVISLDTFDMENVGILIKEYYGSTQEGYYSDNSNKAVLIEYNLDKTVKTLYRGNFKKGQFEDDSNNSWYIVKNSNTPYMYYKGKFRNGIPENNEGSIFKYQLDKETILKLMKSNGYVNNDLKWATE